MHADDWDASDSIRNLVERGARVDPAALAGEDVALEELEPGASRAGK